MSAVVVSDSAALSSPPIPSDSKALPGIFATKARGSWYGSRATGNSNSVSVAHWRLAVRCTEEAIVCNTVVDVLCFCNAEFYNFSGVTVTVRRWHRSNSNAP